MNDDKNKSFMRSLCMGKSKEGIILPFPKLAEGERETLLGVTEAIGNAHWCARSRFSQVGPRRARCPRSSSTELQASSVCSV